MRKGLFRTGNAVRVLLIACGLAVTITTAAPAATPKDTCSDEIRNAAEKVAKTKLAKNHAIINEIYTQDDSVLALTCFNQTASVAGQQAGKAFSGDFRAHLAPVVNQTLSTWYVNFQNHTLGGSSGQVEYASDDAITMDFAPTPISYNCENISKLWNVVNGQGVNPHVPYTSQAEDTREATPPAGGLRHDASLAATANETTVFQDAQDALDDLPEPQTPVWCKLHCRATPTMVMDQAICFGAMTMPAGWDMATACP